MILVSNLVVTVGLSLLFLVIHFRSVHDIIFRKNAVIHEIRSMDTKLSFSDLYL